MYAKMKHPFQNLRKNIPLIISGGAFAMLFATSLTGLLTAAVIIAVLFIASFFLRNLSAFWKTNLSLLSVVLTVSFLAVTAYFFYDAMIYSSKLQSLGTQLGIDSKLIVFALAAAGGIVGFYFLNLILEFILLNLSSPDAEARSGITTENALRIEKPQMLLILATAVVTITICSKSSPLYPFNDWVDANCFLTVGKSMLHGLVPYRDLFEQKGPLLYMLHALAAMVSETSFLGVYFLEIIACAVFLFYAFKIMRLYCSSASILLVPVLSALVYSASSFCHGDSAEELCLPFFAFAIYVGMKGLRRKQSPSPLECLAIGITLACVLWIKFSMLGFYIGWICVPAFLLIKHRKVKKLFQMLLLIAAGVLALSFPILLYFIINHALSDLWTVYFYDNLFAYSVSSNGSLLASGIYNLLGGAKNILHYNLVPAVIAGIGGLSLLKKKDSDFWFIAASAVGTFLLVYIGGRRYTYYSLIFSAFTPVGMAAAFELIRNCYRNYLHIPSMPRIVNQYRGSLVCVLSAVLAFALCGNTYLMQYSKSDLPQYQFAEIIAEVEDATLLNYGFLDGGFYTTTGIVPNCKYFCNLNIGLAEIMETQNEFIQQGKVDFVVTRDTELDTDLYECVAQASFYFEGSVRTYCLYQLIA